MIIFSIRLHAASITCVLLLLILFLFSTKMSEDYKSCKNIEQTIYSNAHWSFPVNRGREIC